MEGKNEAISAQSIVYMRSTGAYGKQNYHLMDEMKKWIKKHDLWTDDGVIYGIARDDIATTPPEKCHYDVCFVADNIVEDNAVRHGTLPAGDYLVFEIAHTVEAVQDFYVSLGALLENNVVRIDKNRPILERYQIALVEKGYCEFCVPILN